MPETLGPLSTFAVLGIGLLFGLKHATEVDHVVAVSTIVSRHRNVWRSSLVGALWGAGHTAALLITGVFVLTLKIAIPERVSNWLEFGVALMIIGLGATALWLALGSHIRHVHTDYDRLLAEGYDRDAARFFVADDTDAVLTGWGCQRSVSESGPEAEGEAEA